MHSKSRRQGFTLIELLVVITVIIVISLSALPAFLNMMKTRGLRDGARVVQQAILQAQTQAVAKRRPFVVEFVDITAGADVAQWKVQIVDCHEDKNGDGDPQDTAPGNLRAPPGSPPTASNDDEIVAEILFAPKLAWEAGQPGSAIGTADGAGKLVRGCILFRGDGSAQPYTSAPENLALAAASDVATEQFDLEFAGADPAANHDFRLTMGEDAVYFNLVPATGRTSVQNNFD